MGCFVELYSNDVSELGQEYPMLEFAEACRKRILIHIVTKLFLFLLPLNLVAVGLLASELVRSLPDRPKSMHPHHFGGSPDARVLKDLYEGLMVQNQNGEPVGGVAEGVEISQDQLTYVFKLRENMRWSDGSSLTGRDFVRSFRALADPANNATYRWYLRIANIKGADKALAGKPSALGVSGTDDDFTIQLSHPSPDLLALMTFPSFFPVAPDRNSSSFVSNGPYVLELNDNDTRLMLRKNRHYRQQEDVTISQVIYQVVENAEQELELFRAGKLHITSSLSVEARHQARRQKLQTLFENQILATTTLIPNQSVPALANPSVRMALSLAIDRPSLVKNNFSQEHVRPACSFTAPLTRGYEPDDDNCHRLLQPSGKNITQARALLNEAGIGPEKLRLTLTTTRKYTTETIANQICQQIEQGLGIKLEPRFLEWSDFLAALQNKDYDLVLFIWLAGYNDASAFLMSLAESRMMGAFSNPDYLSALSQARLQNTMVDRLPFYRKAETILSTELPLIPILHPTYMVLVSPAVDGYYTSNPEGWVHSRNLRLL